ncbi:MAG TPA: hypothetical protein VKG44_05025 [Candidatus Baltobacteraceae bacterium]|nr:hypothetical protein [Candidatus Baltobacteraceae bacterium]
MLQSWGLNGFKVVAAALLSVSLYTPGFCIAEAAVYRARDANFGAIVAPVVEQVQPNPWQATARLSLWPYVVVEDSYAIVSWSIGGSSGQTLLRKLGGRWVILTNAGGMLLLPGKLTEWGVPPRTERMLIHDFKRLGW